MYYFTSYELNVPMKQMNNILPMMLKKLMIISVMFVLGYTVFLKYKLNHITIHIKMTKDVD